jgi:type IV secretory pathway VirB3-like protein
MKMRSMFGFVVVCIYLFVTVAVITAAEPETVLLLLPFQRSAGSQQNSKFMQKAACRCCSCGHGHLFQTQHRSEQSPA